MEHEFNGTHVTHANGIKFEVGDLVSYRSGHVLSNAKAVLGIIYRKSSKRKQRFYVALSNGEKTFFTYAYCWNWRLVAKVIPEYEISKEHTDV